MGFFSRVSDIINANVSDMLDRAEDPEKMVKMLIFEMEEQIETAREGVAKAIAGEKKLEINLTKNRSEADVWHSKAESAIENSDETLARKCLSRKKEHERIADGLQPQWESEGSPLVRQFPLAHPKSHSLVLLKMLAYR